jgi:phasin family protein
MFSDVIEQFQTASQPFSEFLTFSTETAGQLFRKQGEFVSDVLTDSFDFTKEVLAQKDISSVAELQKRYLETMQAKAMANGKEVYQELTEVQEKTTEFMKDLFVKAGEVANG